MKTFSIPVSRLAIARASACACLAGLALGAQAQDAPYPYFGLTLGESRAKFDQLGISQRLLGRGIAVSSLSSDERDRAWRVFGGWQFNRWWALEAAFFDLGQFSFSSATVPAGTLDGNFKLQGGGLDLVGSLPLSDNFSLLGRVGAQYAKTRNSFSTSGAAVVTNPTPSERAGNYKVGVGLQYAFGPNFQMRAEADRYRMKDGFGDQANVNVYSVSLVFPFGRESRRMARTDAPAAYQPPPAPMRAETPPAPMAPVAVAPMAPTVQPMVVAQPRRVSFSAESLFGFDQSALQPAGRQALDGFAREMKGTQFQVIVVEGHTDRLGSAAYNQALSQRRSDVVKDYLVGSGGLDAQKISSTGKGEGSPTLVADACAASLPTAELRRCLQPDRRVDITVDGTR